MEYQAYITRAREGGALHSAGDFAGASHVFRELAEQDLPAMDRANMYLNAAVSLASTNLPSDVESLYDAGIAIERPLFRGRVRASKADWLSQTGRTSEAAGIYTELLAEQWLTATERRQYEELLFKNRA